MTPRTLQGTAVALSCLSEVEDKPHAEDTAHLGPGTWISSTGADLKASFILSSSQGSRKCRASVQERNAIRQT